MLTYKKVPMSTKRSLILQKVQLLHNCTSVYIIVPMLTYKKIHFVYKKDTALVCHTVYERPIRRRHVIDHPSIPRWRSTWTMIPLRQALVPWCSGQFTGTVVAWPIVGWCHGLSNTFRNSPGTMGMTGHCITGSRQPFSLNKCWTWPSAVQDYTSTHGTATFTVMTNGSQETTTWWYSTPCIYM